ncbi:hypothetical protein [Cellulophaga sp. E6(2014)]|uniref:hypothetical protein n=1 Tax=Cellulophaga sp. E6(2014) TaxID=1495334 RepID=UPI000B067E54|nr:hypothetical protein [Cellulophaga sp. E6(2014)]
MKKNKKQSKMVRTFSITIKSIGILMLFIVIMSCKKDKESEPEVVIELNAPIIQTPAPLIHLADNLDEQDELGWCIDTRGNGFAEDLHAHSCKPDGGDVQFYYNEETNQICSAEFVDFCVEMTGGPMEGMTLRLVDSDPSSSEQKFIYDDESGEFRPDGNNNLCLAAGITSASAGIYMSRTLTLELVSDTDVSLKKWVIVSTE